MARAGKAPRPLAELKEIPGYQAALELTDELLRVARQLRDMNSLESRLRIEAQSILLATAEGGARGDDRKRQRFYRHGWHGTYRCTGVIQDARDLGVLRGSDLSVDAVIRRAQQELTIWTGLITRRLRGD